MLNFSFPFAGKSSQANSFVHKDATESIGSNCAVSSGRNLQLSINSSTCKNSDANNKHSVHNVYKRNHIANNILSVTSTAHNNYQLHHANDSTNPKLQNRYSLSHIIASSTNSSVNNSTAIATNRYSDVTDEFSLSSLKKESLSCDSISKSITTIGTFSMHSDVGSSTTGDANEFTRPESDATFASSEYRNSSLLSVNSGLSMCGSSGSSYDNNSASTMACNSPIIALSKSETNIFRTNNDEANSPVFNVVSLNDLNDAEQFFDRPMNDLSKTQCLTQISNQEITRKHSNTLTSPKISHENQKPISIAQNSRDVGDKIF